MIRETEHLLLTALQAAYEAGKAVLEVYGTDFVVDYKDDCSPLTEADRQSHEIISRRLLAEGSCPAATPYPILSEEGKEIPYSARKSWEVFWLVDPLDGTKEFLKRNGEFTVNIALIKGKRPVLGVIYAPVRSVCYFAASGLGSFKLEGDAPAGVQQHREQDAGKGRNGHAGGENVNLQSVLGEARKMGIDQAAPVSSLTVAGSRSHASAELEGFLGRLKSRYAEINLISAGSSLKFCLVAEGSADLYVRHGPTMEWDTAAGQIIVEAAGGRVLDLGTALPLEYNKEILRNPGFIAVRDGVEGVLEARR